MECVFGIEAWLPHRPQCHQWRSHTDEVGCALASVDLIVPVIEGVAFVLVWVVVVGSKHPPNHP